MAAKTLPGMSTPAAESSKAAGPPPRVAATGGRPRKADEARSTIDGLVRVIILATFPFSPSDAAIVAAYRSELTDRLMECAEEFPALMTALSGSTKTIAPLGLIASAIAPIGLAIAANHGWSGLDADTAAKFGVKGEAVEVVRSTAKQRAKTAATEAPRTTGTPAQGGA